MSHPEIPHPEKQPRHAADDPPALDAAVDLQSTRGHRRSLFGALSRSQISAAVASSIDYALLFFLVEVCHVWYVAAVALGALAGAITNFLINRHWSFLAADHGLSDQAVRYATVAGGSLVLNTVGVYVMTETFHVHYSISVFVIAALVGFAFNFPMHRLYVFR